MVVGVYSAGGDERRRSQRLCHQQRIPGWLHLMLLFWKRLPVLLNAPLQISACQGEFNSASILSLFLVARKDTAYHINSDRNIHLYTTLQFVSVCSVTQSHPILREVYVYLYSHCMSMYVCIG